MRMPKIIIWLALIVAWVCGHALLWKDRHSRNQTPAEPASPKAALPVFK